MKYNYNTKQEVFDAIASIRYEPVLVFFVSRETLYVNEGFKNTYILKLKAKESIEFIKAQEGCRHAHQSIYFASNIKNYKTILLIFYNGVAEDVCVGKIKNIDIINRINYIKEACNGRK